MLIEDVYLYCPDHKFRIGSIRTEGNQITDVQYFDGSTPVDSKCFIKTKQKNILIPGLIDIHLHGCVGKDVSDNDSTALPAMAEYLLRQGITGFTPATMTLPLPELEAVFATAGAYIEKTKDVVPDSAMAQSQAMAQNQAMAQDSSSLGAEMLGIHMEGPYFSEKKKGAQSPEHLRLPSYEEFCRLQKRSGGHITQVDVAPELPGALSFIRTVCNEEVYSGNTPIVSLGHTAADYETAVKGFEAGASHVTHLFNGMMPFAHREPGLIGAAADQSNVMVELIGDGIHLHPSMIRQAFRLFGPEHIVLISDSMRAAGMPDGTYTLGGQEVCVQNGCARLADGTIAGSAVNLMDCLRRVVSMGILLEDAVRCTSENQAKELGLFSQIGSIEAGKQANFVLLNSDLTIYNVCMKGNQVFDNIR